MTLYARYALLVVLVVLVTLLVGLQLVADADRAAVWTGLLAAMVVQGPLGWWVVRTIGTPRFLLAWGLGLLARILLVAAMALVFAPLVQIRAEPLLITTASVLLALLLVEGLVALSESPRTAGR